MATSGAIALPVVVVAAVLYGCLAFQTPNGVGGLLRARDLMETFTSRYLLMRGHLLPQTCLGECENCLGLACGIRIVTVRLDVKSRIQYSNNNAKDQAFRLIVVLSIVPF